MRIAVVTQYWPTSEQKWAGHSAYQTVRMLAKRHTVRAFYPEARYPRGLAPATRTHGALDPHFQPAGVPTTYLSYVALPLISRPVNGWFMYRSLFGAVAEFKPDVILSYVVYPDGYAAVKIGKRLGIPVVLTAIGSDLNRIPDRFCALHTRYALQHASHVTTVSGHLKQTALGMGSPATKTTAILNGCDTSVFHPQDRARAREDLGIPADVRGMVYVGRLDVRKGLIELVEAMSELRAAIPTARCYMVGDGSDRALIVDAINRYNVADVIQLVLPVDTVGVARWMAASDLVTLPSYAEGCPNVIIEALASGRPVVATNVGGIPELMHGNVGALVDPRDAPGLCGAIERVLSEKWDESELSAGHSRSWNDVSIELESVLESVL